VGAPATACALAIFFGFYPAPIMNVTAASVDQCWPIIRPRYRPPANCAALGIGHDRATSRFLPIMPELILAIGALDLLLIGVYGGERSTSSVTVLSVVLLAAAGIAVVDPGPLRAFSGAFDLRSVRAPDEAADAARLAVAIVMSVGIARAENTSASSSRC
jgi:hypothetical protein